MTEPATAAPAPAAILESDRLRNPSSARMGGAGTAYKLHVTLKVHVPGHGNQAPRRGGCQPRRQEAEPGTQNPSPAPPAPTIPAPAPARGARRRGPGALLRDERRRLARIEPNLLLSDPAPLLLGDRTCNA